MDIVCTFSPDSTKGMDVVFGDKLLLQDHLHRDDDLSHDDQKVSWSAEEKWRCISEKKYLHC